jgi:hypothetical protein
VVDLLIGVVSRRLQVHETGFITYQNDFERQAQLRATTRPYPTDGSKTCHI